MANTVKLKRSAVAGKTPTAGDLELGELAVNTYDGKLFLKKDNGTASIVEIGAGGGGGGSGDVVGPASATDNAIVRYDGTTGKLVQNSATFVDDDGNVLIGTSATPSGWEDVGLISIDGASGSALFFNAGAEEQGFFYTAPSTAADFRAYYGLVLRAGDGKVTFADTGRIGIGSEANNPQSWLELSAPNNTDATPWKGIAIDGATDNGNDFGLAVSAGSGAYRQTAKFGLIQTPVDGAAYAYVDMSDSGESFRVTFDDRSTTALQVNSTDVTAHVDINVRAALKIVDAENNTYVGFSVSNPVNTTYTLPSADGTNGQFLKTNGSGTLSWGTASGGGSAGDRAFTIIWS